MPQNPDQGAEVLADTVALEDAVIAEAIGPDIGTEAAASDAPNQPRDERGRFAATAEQDPTTDEVIADATTATDEGGEPEPEEAPEEETPADEPEAATEPEKPKPLAPFTARDAAGQELEAPDLKLSFKAGGKDHVDVPLDKVVRWAQSGFHVEQVTQEAADLKQRLPRYEQQLNDLTQSLEDQRALNTRLMEDEQFFLTARERWAQQNTPEQRLAREQQRLQQERAAFDQQRLEQEAGAFLQNVTLPRVQALHEQYPTVTEKEIVGALMIELAPLQRNGRVPREQWNEAIRLLDNNVREYVAAQHNMRDSVRATAETTAKRQVTRAQEEATKAKRQLAKAIAPASGKTAPPVTKPPATAEEAADALANEVLAEVLGG